MSAKALEALEAMSLLFEYQEMKKGGCGPALTYEQKAKQGDARSQWLLADLYRRGLCVPLNKAEMARWLRAAAKQNFADAQWELGSPA